VLHTRELGGVLAPPLPGFASFFIASFPTLAVSPSGVASAAGVVVPFSGQGRFQARHQGVWNNRSRLVRVSSPAQAGWLAAELNRLAVLPEGERAGALSQWLAARLDAARVVARLEAFKLAARLPSLTAAAIFGWVFLATPLFIGSLGLALTWPWLLIGLVLLCGLNAALFFRAHRRLYPERDDERFAHLLMALLFPPAGMRARDLLSRPLLETFHPLAVAKELCPATEFDDLAGRVVRELRHPRPPRSGLAVEALSVWSGFHESLRQAVEQFLVRHGLSPDQFTVPPTPSDPECRSYCPRCHAQFVRVDGGCSDCGVALARFPGA
jgi:hypothetical protein